MENKPDEKENRQSPEQISGKQEKPHMDDENDTGFATRRPNEVNEEEEKKLFEERQKKLKKAA